MKIQLPQALPYKIQLPPNVSQNLKRGEVALVNIARNNAANQWEKAINDIINTINNKYKEKIKKLFIEIIKSDISSDNRYLPPPVNKEVLKKILAKYSVLNTFLNKNIIKEINESYSDSLINYHINRIFNDESYSKINVYSSSGEIVDKNKTDYKQIDTDSGIWVQIPSRRKDKRHPGRNTAILEALSSPNWCTRSRYDKAEDVLREGDFYIYLQKKSDKFIPVIGMPTTKGTIIQIQGQNNDEYIPFEYLNTIKTFININNIQLSRFYSSDGLAAATQIAICEKLNEQKNGISLQNAIETSNKILIEELLLNGKSINKKTEDDFILVGNQRENIRAKMLDFGLTNEKILEITQKSKLK